MTKINTNMLNLIMQYLEAQVQLEQAAPGHFSKWYQEGQRLKLALILEIQTNSGCKHCGNPIDATAAQEKLNQILEPFIIK